MMTKVMVGAFMMDCKRGRRIGDDATARNALPAPLEGEGSSAMTPRFLQLASPALPVGAYSYSQGLEWAIESGAVKSITSAAAWIRDHLLLVFSRFEGPLYAAAFNAWSTLPDARDELLRLNTEFIASRESAEPRAETIQVGFSYAAWCRDVAQLSDEQRAALATIDSVCAPIAASLAACACKLSAHDGLMAYTFGFAENQVMVLAKALPLGQIAAQKMLFALGDTVETCVATALQLPPEDWSSASPLLTIAQMKHETQYSRLFRS
jgi:urease accessory protein